MLNLLTPKKYVQSIHEIDLDKLRSLGIKAIFSDLDNTLVPWDSDKANPELLAWLAKVKAQGFKVCLVSNAVSDRVRSFTMQLQIPGWHKAGKPFARGFRAAMQALGVSAVETALIGDQVFTDMLGGNRLGMYTILVVPMSKNEFIGTKIVRRVERVLLRHLRRKGALS